MKSDGRMARCPLRGRIGYAVFAVLCACGHNIRIILAYLRAFYCVIVCLIVDCMVAETTRQKTVRSGLSWLFRSD